MSLSWRISLAEYGIVSIVDDDGKELGNVLMVEILNTSDGMSKVELIWWGRQQNEKSLTILKKRIKDYMADSNPERVKDFRFSGTFENKENIYEVVERLYRMCEEDSDFGETAWEGFVRELMEELILEFKKVHDVPSLWTHSQASTMQSNAVSYGRVVREKISDDIQYIYSTWFHKLQLTKQELFEALGSWIYTVFPNSIWRKMDSLGFGEVYYESQWISYKVWDNIIGNYALLVALMKSKWKKLLSINETVDLFTNLEEHFMT